MTIALLAILIFVLVLPFTVKVVERNLEVFILIMGLLAALISGTFNHALLMQAIKNPFFITLAVFLAGLLFKWGQSSLQRSLTLFSTWLPQSVFLALVVLTLSLLSSIITAIIAALVLVSIVSLIRLDRESEIRFTILACFGIGIGAVLTPLGEPLATIAITKLNQDFDYLLNLVGRDVLLAIAIITLLTLLLVKPRRMDLDQLEAKTETYLQILIRAAKVYLFVMGLTFFGHGFQPFIDTYLLGLDAKTLYWVNMISAVLDNATLTAAEISPAMDELTVRAILLGLVISGGMLIPGNIPNIVSANRLNISSKEWAAYGVPIGLKLMAIFFLFIFLFD